MASEKRMASEDPLDSRVEFILDHGHNPTEEGEDQRTVEINELRRLCASARGGRRASLEEEIKALLTNQAPPRQTCFAARPMSARRNTISVMKTIPESKEHTRPLSSKMKSASNLFKIDTSSLIPPPLTSYHHHHRRRGNDASSVSSSIGSNESACIDDEIDRYEVQKLWSTSNDTRFPIANVLDRSSMTFWIATGLFPQLILFRFRRPIALGKVLVYCHGVHTLTLKWRQHDDPKSIHLSQSAPDAQSPASSTEFIFDIAPPGSPPSGTPSHTQSVLLEIVNGPATFPIIRHVNFVELASSRSTTWHSHGFPSDFENSLTNKPTTT